MNIDRSEFEVRALLVGERIDQRAWERLDPLATNPLAIALGTQGVVILFRYGAIVFFDVTPHDERVFLDTIGSRLIGAYRTPEVESLHLRVVPSAREAVASGAITVEALTVDRLQLAADVLSKSVVLAMYESRVASTFERIEPLATQLEETGRFGANEKELLRHIGATLRIDHTMVGRIAVSEKPELLWDNPGLEGLYNGLEDEFEIRERHRALEHKLNVISRTAETLLELIQSRHSLRVEWYIVALIVVEIVLTLFQTFRR